jgi:VCBS repeat-containing protein
LIAALGTGKLALGSPVTSNGGTNTIGWTYDPGAANLDFLAAGQTLTVTYGIKVGDGPAFTATQNLVITIEGTNDAPTDIEFLAISPGNTLPGAASTIATLSTVDPDNSSGFSYTFSGAGATITSNSVDFRLESNSLMATTLAADKTYSLNVVSTDSGGLQTTQTLNIITGTERNSGDIFPSATDGDDIIYTLSSGTGSNQKDMVFAGSGNDTIFGQLGVDELHGGLGNDVLYGGGGNDALFGDGGNDMFVFDTALNGITNVDHISDFTNNEDTIFLSHAIFANLTTVNGTLGASDYGAVSNGTGASATSFGSGVHIIYDSQTGNLYYDSDGGNTTTGRTLFAVLDNKPDISLFNNGDIQVGT